MTAVTTIVTAIVIEIVTETAIETVIAMRIVEKTIVVIEMMIVIAGEIQKNVCHLEYPVLDQMTVAVEMISYSREDFLLGRIPADAKTNQSKLRGNARMRSLDFKVT